MKTIKMPAQVVGLGEISGSRVTPASRIPCGRHDPLRPCDDNCLYLDVDGVLRATRVTKAKPVYTPFQKRFRQQAYSLTLHRRRGFWANVARWLSRIGL